MRMRMKKLLSILLVTAMLASMAVTAFADAPAASNFDGDIMVAAVTDISITEDTSTAFTKGTDGNEGKWVGTATVTNGSNAQETVTFTGIVTDSADAKVEDATVEVTLQATQRTAIDVPANGCTLDVVVEFTGTPAVGEYKVKLHTGTENEAVQVGTITIEDETKTATVASVAPVAEDGSYTATHSNGTISFTATNFAKDGTVGVKITLAGDVADNAECTYQIDSDKAETATLVSKVLTIEGIAVGEEKTSKTLKVTPVGCEAIELTLNFDGINFVVDPAPTGDVTLVGNVTLPENLKAGEKATGGSIVLKNTNTAATDVTIKAEITPPQGAKATDVIKAKLGNGEEKDLLADAGATFSIPVGNSNTITFSDVTLNTPGNYSIKFTITPVGSQAITKTVAATVTDPNTNPPVTTTVTAALGAFTLDKSDTTGKTYTGELTLTRTGTGSVDVTVTDVTLSEGTAIITIDDAVAKGKKITVNKAEVKVPVKVVYADNPAAGDYKVTATLTGTTNSTVTGNLNVINPDEASAVLEVGEPNADGVVTGTLTLSNPTNAKITPTVKVEVVGQSNITVTPTTGEWTNNAAVEVEAGTKETPTTKVLGFTITFSKGTNDANYTIKATVGDLAVIGDGSITIPGNGGTVDPTPNPDPNPGDNGSSNSGGSSSSNEDNTPANAPSANVGSNGAVSAAKISGDAKKAVSNAKNGKANVNVTNAKTVGTAALNNMAKAAAKEDVALTMTAKTTDKNGVVVASLKFDATKAAEAVAKAGTKEVKLGVELNTKNTKNVTSLFKKWFKNKNIAVVKMAQKGEFGFTVEAAVKVDLKNFNKNNLKFYSYNAATNTYKEIETKYTIDAKGLVHFNTTVGNYVIITDAPIASK